VRLVVLTLLLVLLVAPAEAAAPTSVTLFGMNVPSLGALDSSETAVGARAAIVGSFADWAHTPDFPRAYASQVRARGAVPMISWEPWDSWAGGADQPAYALDRVAAGDHDALIDRWAAQIAAYGHPVMLRFAAEMNGDWLPWSTGVNGNGPGDYVAAWRHVRERFRMAGATNALFVWNPIAAYEGSTPLADLYPGDADWVAVDGYNWGATRSWGWQSYAGVLAPTVRALAALAPGRPVMIAEIGCAPDRRKAVWITDALDSAQADGVDAVVWFEYAKETDWRLAENGSTARAARSVLKTRAWRQGGDTAAVERAVLG
jgi:beta-mannanase